MATATKAKPRGAAAAKAPAQDELSSLAAAAKGYEDVERSKTTQSNSFITLVQGNSAVLKPDSESYVKSVKLYDYVITKSKTRLGQTLDATILGMFKLYTETERKQNDSDMAKVVQFWMPEDAVQLPLLPGSNFDRQTREGNILSVTHWVFLHLHKHPEIDDAVLTFRSIGNKVYNDLAKLVAANSSLCTELRFVVTKQAIKSKNYSEAYYYPKFEIVGRNYKYAEGKVARIAEGLDADELEDVLRRSGDLYKAYANMQMVSKKRIDAPAAPEAKKALPGAGYKIAEDDGDVTF
jgi:hypothetical protein